MQLPRYYNWPSASIFWRFMFYCWCFFVYFFISPRYLRALSADHRGNLPRDRKLVQFCNPSPKICFFSSKKWDTKAYKIRRGSENFKLRLQISTKRIKISKFGPCLNQKQLLPRLMTEISRTSVH